MDDPFYHSAEIRWFLPSQDPWNLFLEWFSLRGQLPIKEEGAQDPQEKGHPFIRQERARTDDYLLLPNCLTAGLKQRQGKLEIKALLAGPAPFSRGDVLGRADQWVKWSFEPSTAKLASGAVFGDELKEEMSQAGPWRRVEKRRYLQKYADDRGQPVAVAPDRRPEAGCNIELTRVSVNAKIPAWIAFGFEAFGPPGRTMAMLEAAVEFYFSRHGRPPAPLDYPDSLSYPGWLAHLD